MCVGCPITEGVQGKERCRDRDGFPLAAGEGRGEAAALAPVCYYERVQWQQTVM